MLVDLDSFFASVEERGQPKIRGKPVVVVVYTRGGQSGAVATANYAARSLGIKSGLPLFQAKSKATKDTVFLPTNFDLYTRVSKRVMTLLEENADVLEQVSIDEAYLDVSKRCSDFGEAELLANRIKEQIKKEERITCSIGISSSKPLAKIAAGLKKPDALVVVLPGKEKSFLENLPAGELPGVGKKAQEKLSAIGVKTIGELSKIPLQQLHSLFGKSWGNYLFNASKGNDDSPVATRGPRKQAGRISTLDENTRDEKLLKNFLEKLCKQVVQRCAGRRFQSIGVMAVLEDLTVVAKSRKLKEPTDSLETLQENAFEMLLELLKLTEKDFRRLGVRVANFAEKEKKDAAQKTLFG